MDKRSKDIWFPNRDIEDVGEITSMLLSEMDASGKDAQFWFSLDFEISNGESVSVYVGDRVPGNFPVKNERFDGLNAFVFGIATTSLSGFIWHWILETNECHLALKIDRASVLNQIPFPQ